MENKTILVSGGAGYIGSFMVRNLLEKGHKVIVIDNLSRGHNDYISQNANFIQGDIGDRDFVASIVSTRQIDGVIHFAGYISMAESMQKPGLYFEENTYKSLNFFQSLVDNNIKRIIFSSTAGVYGNPTSIPIPESHSTKPTNPYGESKLMVEKILSWFNKIYGLNFAALRYFNACGASIDGLYGENHDPETHIIPQAMKALKSDSEFSLYGTDYQTKDGTCIRDYIHVLDLVEAHILALEKIVKEPGGYIYNVGTGQGFSNREIIQKIEEVAGKKINVIEKDRRPGDASELVADVTKIKSEIGFNPKYSDLTTIIDSAWKWHSKQL